MVVLKFLHLWSFFKIVEKYHKDFMTFDLGEISTGICICKASKEIYPIMGNHLKGYDL